MYCRKCGNEIPEDTKFCPHCGTSCDANPAAGQTAGPTPQSYTPSWKPTQAAPQNSYPTVTKSPKQRRSTAIKLGIAAAIYGIVFGAISFITSAIQLTGASGYYYRYTPFDILNLLFNGTGVTAIMIGLAALGYFLIQKSDDR